MFEYELFFEEFNGDYIKNTFERQLEAYKTYQSFYRLFKDGFSYPVFKDLLYRLKKFNVYSGAFRFLTERTWYDQVRTDGHHVDGQMCVRTHARTCARVQYKSRQFGADCATPVDRVHDALILRCTLHAFFRCTTLTRHSAPWSINTPSQHAWAFHSSTT